jgi:hypothetical protein
MEPGSLGNPVAADASLRAAGVRGALRMGFELVTRQIPTWENETIPTNYGWWSEGRKYFGMNDPTGERARAAKAAFEQIMRGGRWLVKHASEPNPRLCRGWGTFGNTPSVRLEARLLGGCLEYKWTGIQSIEAAPEED